jgi:hypothetical protein
MAILSAYCASAVLLGKLNPSDFLRFLEFLRDLWKSLYPFSKGCVTMRTCGRFPERPEKTLDF